MMIRENKMTFKNNKQNGVSLTELAIVVAIIGLLLASIVGGTSLLSAAKARHLFQEHCATFFFPLHRHDACPDFPSWRSGHARHFTTDMENMAPPKSTSFVVCLQRVITVFLLFI